jgi:Flp pilus assembly protein TadG
MIPPRRIIRTHATRAECAPAPGLRAERGAILVQVAAMMLGLTALSAFIVDYGILWTARRQAQNAADAAAMAAAASLAFEAPGDQARAFSNAVTAVANNRVWGAAVPLAPGDVTFPPCPAGSIGSGTCVRVQVLRNEDNDAALPTVFGALVGVTEQGVRATATAQVLYGDATDCVKPLAVPDRWDEQRNNVGPPSWEVMDTFERYAPGGALLPGPVHDRYDPPSPVPGPNGTGLSRGPSSWTSGDYGQRLEMHPSPNPLIDLAGGERLVPVQIDGAGAGPFLDGLTSCSPRVIRPGDRLEVELSNVNGATGQGFSELIARDPGATWDFSLHGGRGGVAGGCMASGTCCSAGTCTSISPRIIALPVYNPDLWNQNPPGAATVVVTRIVGFFVERYSPSFNEVVGRLMIYPVLPRSTMTASPSSSFVASVTLVR